MHFLYLISFLGAVALAAKTESVNLQDNKSSVSVNQTPSSISPPKKEAKVPSQSATQPLSPPRYKKLKRTLPKGTSKQSLAEKHHFLKESNLDSLYKDKKPVQTIGISPKEDRQTVIKSNQQSEDEDSAKILHHPIPTVKMLDIPEAVNIFLANLGESIADGYDTLSSFLNPNDVEESSNLAATDKEKQEPNLASSDNIQNDITSQTPASLKIDESQLSKVEDFDPELQALLSEGLHDATDTVSELTDEDEMEIEVEMNEFPETKPVKPSQNSAFSPIPKAKSTQRKKLSQNNPTAEAKITKAEVKFASTVNTGAISDTIELQNDDSVSDAADNDIEANQYTNTTQCAKNGSDSRVPVNFTGNYITFDLMKWYAVQYVVMALLLLLVIGFLAVHKFSTKKLRKSAF